MSAAIFSIVYKPQDTESRPGSRYAREAVSATRLIAGYGIEGDAKGGKHPKRHLNIMAYETVNALGAEGFSVQPGELGEQITLRGLDIDTLPPGTVLQLGASAQVELTEARTGCDRFEAIQGLPPSAAAKRMGMMARVIATGDVRVGDPVTVIQPVSLN